MSFFVVGFTLISLVNSHSWVACSDYQPSNPFVSGHTYADGDCKGYIREWTLYGSIPFGQDRGADYRPAGTNQICHKVIQPDNNYAASYTTQYPAAQYTVGQSIKLLWPAKNHANFECFNFIPDRQMKIYMNTNINPTSDPSDINGFTLVKDLHDNCTPGTDGCGFQNCLDFCADTGNAICSGDFIVPSVSQSGYYTFIWYWEFNSGEFFSSCWEAFITVNSPPSPTLPSVSPVKNPTMTPVINPTSSPVVPTTTSPAGIPTLQPSQSPVPTIATSNGIQIRNQPQSQEYWVAFFIENIGCGSISNVEIRDGGSYTTWKKYDVSDTFYAFNTNGNSYSLPLDVRITNTNGEILILNGIITSFGNQNPFISNQNFCLTQNTQTQSTQVTQQTTNPPINSNTISIEIAGGVGEWWFAFFTRNDDCNTISSVYIKDSGSYTTWYSTTQPSDYFWAFNNNGQSFTLPISVRLVDSSGNEDIATNIITSFTGTFQTNIAYPACLKGGNNNNNNILVNFGDFRNYTPLNWVILMAILSFIILCLLLIVLTIKCHLKKEKYTIKEEKTINKDDDIATTGDDDTPSGTLKPIANNDVEALSQQINTNNVISIKD